MNIFNSLGSNYTLPFALKSLFSAGTYEDSKRLEKLLEKRYSGKVELFYKGREALSHALTLLDLPDTSLVAINGFTCVAVYNAIRNAGFEPLCLDLEKNSDLNFSAKTLEKAVRDNKNIRVVVIQNTLGYPCDIQGIAKMCQKYKLILIEDLAHCVGTQYINGKEAGTVGDFTVLSFSQDKIIDAVTGGALVIRNKKYDAHTSELLPPAREFKDRLYPILTYKIRFFYNIGLGKVYHFILKKGNLLSNIMDEAFYSFYSLPPLSALLALNQFQHLEKQLKHRKTLATYYSHHLPKNIVRTFLSETVDVSSNLRFPIFLENRDSLIQFLKHHGVFVADIWYSDVSPQCPNAVEESKQIVNLPTHIHVSTKNAQRIVELIHQWIKLQ